MLPRLLVQQSVLATACHLPPACFESVSDLYSQCCWILRLAEELDPKIKDLEKQNASLLQFQTDAVLDAGTPPSRTAVSFFNYESKPH